MREVGSYQREDFSQDQIGIKFMLFYFILFFVKTFLAVKRGGGGGLLYYKVFSSNRMKSSFQTFEKGMNHATIPVSSREDCIKNLHYYRKPL